MIGQNGFNEPLITASDRSFQYGDGCFSTLLIKQGKIQLWDYHQERMEACLQRLTMPSPDWLKIELALNQAAIGKPLAGIKLHISRGEGGRGYSPSQAHSSRITLSHFDFPAHYHQWQRQGVTLGVCEQRMGLNPLLAGHKHNNRLEQVLLRGEMDRAGYDDGVCLDLNHHIVETTMANLFWVKNGTLYTPSLDNAGVAGVARRMILQSATSFGLTVEIGQFSIEHLIAADEVFMSNAIIEVAPVIGIAHHLYTIGRYVRDFQESFNS